MVMNAVKSDSKASYLLDLLRFLSAMIVFLMHFGYGLPGYQAVMIFFVLSGFFISTGVIRDISSGKFSWKSYLTKRLVRLYIVLIPALLITYVAAKIQVYYFGGGEYFEGTLDFKTLFGNIFYLQGIAVEQYGLNGPLWSLSYELWYYILFPIAILTFTSKKWIHKILYGTLFVAISFMVGKLIMMYFLVWLLGAVIALVKPMKFKREIINYFVLAVLAVALYYSTSVPYELTGRSPGYKDPAFLADLTIGICFALFAYWLIAMFNDNVSKRDLSLFKKLAGFSYTLYLVHYPFKYIWKAWIESEYWTISYPVTLKVKWLYMLVVVVICYLLAKVTEEKTGRVVKKVQALIGK